MSIAEKILRAKEDIDAAYAAGKAAGGGNADPAAEAVMALLSLNGSRAGSVFDNNNIKVSENIYHCNGIDPNSGLVVHYFTIIPPQVTKIDGDINNYDSSDSDFHDQIVLCLPTEPPTMMWQGDWARSAGNCPPKAIYVPDESVDAYKVATNWAEFADIIKPMSELSQGG